MRSQIPPPVISTNPPEQTEQGIARRMILGAALAALVSPTGCTTSTPPREEETREARAVLAKLDKLPALDPAIGRVAAIKRMEGAEKLLIVVRYSHCSNTTLETLSDEARAAIVASRPQVDALLEIALRFAGTKEIRGDGLLLEDAAERNGLIAHIRKTNGELGAIVRFRTVEALESANRAIVSNPKSSDSERFAAKNVLALVATDRERIKRLLSSHHEALEHLKEMIVQDPIVRAAVNSGVRLVATEDPILHQMALNEAMAPSFSKARFDELSERREDAILERVSQSEGGVHVLLMGAVHRFSDAAERRRELDAAKKISIVEFNPAALPDDVETLIRLINGDTSHEISP